MTIILPDPPEKYDARSERDRNEALRQADRRNLKAGVDIYPAGIVLQTPNGSFRRLTIADDGTVGSEAV